MHIKKKYPLIFIVVIALQGCIQSKNCSVVGYYRSIGEKQKVIHTLELLSDSTFTYKLKGDLMDSESKGRWYFHKRRVILNSFDSLRPGRYIINSISDSLCVNSGTLYLQVSDQKNVPLPYAIVEYAGIKINTDFAGKAQLKKLEVDSLVITFITEKFVIHNALRENLLNKVTLFVQGSTSLYFNDESFSIRKKKLYSSLDIVFERLW